MFRVQFCEDSTGIASTALGEESREQGFMVYGLGFRGSASTAQGKGITEHERRRRIRRRIRGQERQEWGKGVGSAGKEGPGGD